MVVGRIQFHGCGKLVPRGFGFAYFQQRIGEVFADVRALWSKRDGPAELCYGSVIGSSFQRGISRFEVRARGVYWL